MSRYEEIDLHGIRTYPVRGRRSLVEAGGLYRAPESPGELEGFDAFWTSLPDVLAARDLKDLVERTRVARAGGGGFLLMFGGHVIKTGLGPGLIRLMEEGWISALAMNGAGSIHDLEIGCFGKTSEDVAHQLPAGRFGMARETSQWLNAWTVEAARRGEGLGEGLGRAIAEQAGEGAGRSVLAAAWRLSIPATVHLAIGADINHQHPGFPGAAAGETTTRDFRILCRQVQTLEQGVALNVGSAVILPEVFLKALSVAINLGGKFDGLTTAVFDFQRHYRPQVNVAHRPTLQGGKGFYLVGHHELLLPLFIHALLRYGMADRPARKKSRATGRRADLREDGRGDRRLDRRPDGATDGAKRKARRPIGR